MGRIVYFREDFPKEVFYEDLDGTLIPNIGEMVCIEDEYYQVEVIVVFPEKNKIDVILSDID